MVCVSEPTFPGCVIPVKPIALFRMEDDQGVDDKVLCVPLSDPAWNTLEELDDLPEQLQHEIAHFFSVYKDLEQKKVKVDGWYSREDAMKEIEAARERCTSTAKAMGTAPTRWRAPRRWSSWAAGRRTTSPPPAAAATVTATRPTAKRGRLMARSRPSASSRSSR